MTNTTDTSGIDTSELATYRGRFNDCYAELEELLDGLPSAALLWKPFEQSPWKGSCNSIGEIVAHAVSSNIYLLRRAEYAMGRREWDTVDGDEGKEEFGPANHDPAYLLARVRRTHDELNRFLDSIQTTDLDATRPHPKRPRTFVARQDFMHALDHFALHIGHGEITRQLWAIDSDR